MSEESSAQSGTVPAHPDASTARPGGPVSDIKEADVALPTGNGANDAPDTTQANAAIGSNTKHTAQKPTHTTEAMDTADAGDTRIDTETKTDEVASAAVGEGSADPAISTPASGSKSKARRKSGGVPEHKAKKLNKKASKVKMSHTDAKPGEHYYIRLKGYPLWPGIVCDESMLPQSLISSRPVTAARADGTYRDDYENGGKKVHERTFPVMYLATNEFGWIPNYDLIDMDLEQVGNFESKGRKELYHAHKLAAENHDLDHYKQVLLDFEAQREADNEAKAAAKAAKEASKSSGKSKKKGKADPDATGEENEDVDMADAEGELDADEGAEEKKPKPSKKRKAITDAEDPNTPQASSSAKKIKFKPVTSSTPKTANGATPKSTSKKDSTSKPSKPKAKKSATNGTVEKAPPTPKEPEPSPEEKRAKKEKEILFLRHKLQKGLLTRDQQPKEEEMKQMSEFISKLEGYADLEVSIIRQTKINKVLKAILKLAEIPRESEFQFKDRSKSLLEKWNKILESAEQPAASTSTPAAGDESAPKELTNGVSTGIKVEEKRSNGEEKYYKSEEPVTAGVSSTVKQEVDAKEEPVAEQKPADDPVKPSVTEPLAV